MSNILYKLINEILDLTVAHIRREDRDYIELLCNQQIYNIIEKEILSMFDTDIAHTVLYDSPYIHNPQLILNGIHFNIKIDDNLVFKMNDEIVEYTELHDYKTKGGLFILQIPNSKLINNE